MITNHGFDNLLRVKSGEPPSAALVFIPQGIKHFACRILNTHHGFENILRVQSGVHTLMWFGMAKYAPQTAAGRTLGIFAAGRTIGIGTRRRHKVVVTSIAFVAFPQVEPLALTVVVATRLCVCV